jgi:hypothetical protein
MVATVVLIKALGGGWLGVPAQPGSISTAVNQQAIAQAVSK